MTNVASILKSKPLGLVHSISASASVFDAVRLMAHVACATFRWWTPKGS
jgi:hypothetical protein